MKCPYRRLFGQAMLTAVIVAVVSQYADAQDTLAKIKQNGVVEIANSGVFPPFEFMEGDRLAGFDIDLSRLIAKGLGVRADITVIDFKGLIPALKSGKTDLLITAMTYQPARSSQVAFSEPYYETATAIATRANSSTVKSKSDLSGMTVGAELGTTGELQARAIVGVKEVKTYDTLMLALRDLEIGRIDAVISNLPNLQYLIHRNFPQTKIAGRYDAGWVGINTRKSDTALLAAVNGILKRLKENEELNQLYVKWFGEDPR